MNSKGFGKWRNRQRKLNKRRYGMIQHGKSFGEMVRNAVRKKKVRTERKPTRIQRKGRRKKK